MALRNIFILVLIAITQYALWFGSGGLHHNKLQQDNLTSQEKTNSVQREKNASVEKQIQSLTSNTSAIEERARQELNLIKKDEVFIRILPAQK